MPTLHIEMIRTLTIEAFKILHKNVAKILIFFFRHEYLVEMPTVRTSRYGKATFRFKAAQLWNSL